MRNWVAKWVAVTEKTMARKNGTLSNLQLRPKCPGVNLSDGTKLRKGAGEAVKELVLAKNGKSRRTWIKLWKRSQTGRNTAYRLRR